MLKPSLFCYAIPETVVPANGQIAPQINFANDSDFELVEIRATQHTINDILMQLSQASGEILSNVPIDTFHFAGTSYPIRLPSPVIFPANTQLNVLLINSTAGDLTSQIQFWGYKKPVNGY